MLRVLRTRQTRVEAPHAAPPRVRDARPIQSTKGILENPVKRNLRDYARQTDRRLIAGGAILLILVGGGLIWWLYGTGGAGLGVTCIVAGLAPVVLILLVFKGMDWILRHAGRK